MIPGSIILDASYLLREDASTIKRQATGTLYVCNGAPPS